MAAWCVGIAVFSQKASFKGIQYKPVESREWLQRWTDTLRPGPTLTLCTPWPIQSRECQTLPKMPEPPGHSPPEHWDTNNTRGSSVLPSPQPEAEQAMASGSQEHPAKGQQDGDGQSGQGCWSQQQQEVTTQQSIVTHSAHLAHNCLGLKDVVSKGNALLQEGTCHEGTAQRPPGACFSGPVCLNSNAGCTGLSLLALMPCPCSG